MRSHAITLCLGIGVLLLVVGIVHPPPAHAAVLASVETTDCPAPERVVKLALGQYRATRHVYRAWMRARDCLGLTGDHRRLAAKPSRDESAAVWLVFMEKVQRQRALFRDKLKRCVWLMKHPGGTSNGVRWLPLARWVGWPEYTLSTLAAIIMRESTGRVRALNQSSGCAGLLQIHPCHGVANVFDPEVNLRAGLRLYRASGWAPWSLY